MLLSNGRMKKTLKWESFIHYEMSTNKPIFFFAETIKENDNGKVNDERVLKLMQFWSEVHRTKLWIVFKHIYQLCNAKMLLKHENKPTHRHIPFRFFSTTQRLWTFEWHIWILPFLISFSTEFWLFNKSFWVEENGFEIELKIQEKNWRKDRNISYVFDRVEIYYDVYWTSSNQQQMSLLWIRTFINMCIAPEK